MEYVIAALILIIILLIYGIYNLISKYEILEDDISEFDLWVETTHANIKKAYFRMKAIDRLGSFEADDESGFIFKQIKSSMEALNEKLNLDGSKAEEEED
jgi:hypothetical protein